VVVALLVAGSWDVWATYSGGNVEAMLLVDALVVARLLLCLLSF